MSGIATRAFCGVLRGFNLFLVNITILYPLEITQKPSVGLKIETSSNLSVN